MIKDQQSTIGLISVAQPAEALNSIHSYTHNIVMKPLQQYCLLVKHHTIAD